MFIYRITNLQNEKIYIGYDSGAISESRRWDYHKKSYLKQNKVLYFAMRKYGIENFSYEQIDTASTLSELIEKEICHIELAESYIPSIGYNRTFGGDGGDTFSVRSSKDQADTRKKMSASHIERFRYIDSDTRDDIVRGIVSFTRQKKWSGMSVEDRKKATAHLHNDLVYEKKSVTLKKYYAENPDIKLQKAVAIDRWREQYPDKLREQNSKASLLGAAKVSKKVKVEFQDGSTKVYKSKSEYVRENGHDLKYVIMKTKQGFNHKGKKAWEL